MALKSTAVVGASVMGLAYYQRLPRRYADHHHPRQESIPTTLYRTFLAPVIYRTDPEFAHRATVQAVKLLQSVRMLAEPSWTGPLPLDWLLRPPASAAVSSGPSIKQEMFGGRLRFETPFGVAAGFDKNAELVPLLKVGAIRGLGFAEVGSISALPSDGNPKPRCFRVPSDEAVINRMGLNNDGSEVIAERLQSFSSLKEVPGGPPRAPLGVNITKTHSPTILGEAALDDFVTSFGRLYPHSDFLVLNVSCPNTAEGKTFEERDTLTALLARIRAARSACADQTAPVLLKLSPPVLGEDGRRRLRELVDVALTSGTVDGFVVSNTAGDRDVPLTLAGKGDVAAIGRGGLSGKPLRARSTAAIREVYRLTGGAVPIIGVGGVDSAEAAYEKIRAGASLVEVYTGMVFRGPCILEDMHVGLRFLLERDGFSCIQDAVGADFRPL